MQKDITEAMLQVHMGWKNIGAVNAVDVDSDATSPATAVAIPDDESLIVNCKGMKVILGLLTSKRDREELTCAICNVPEHEHNDERMIQCSTCNKWSARICLGVSATVFNTYAASVFWECPTCAAMATAAVAPAPIMQVVVDPIRIAPIGNLNLGAQPNARGQFRRPVNRAF